MSNIKAALDYPSKQTFWLSFADEDEGFLGVAIVDLTGAEIIQRTKIKGEGALTRSRNPNADAIAAIQKTHDLGINPGGHVACTEIPQANYIADEFKDRLLDRDEAERLKAMPTRRQ